MRALNALVFAALPALIAADRRGGYSARRASPRFAALLWARMPLVAGAPLVTPDAPLVVFWTLALLALVEVWRGRAAWLAAGRRWRLGLALLAKFTAAFLGAGIALALVATPSLRRVVLRAGALSAAALARS